MRSAPKDGPADESVALDSPAVPPQPANMVMRVLSQGTADEVVRTLPDNFREWIDAEAA